MQTEYVEMTPAMAKALLDKNTNNRPVSQRRVSSLANQMRQGMWKLNGETIIVADTGRLLDGQHRLMAVILAGVAVSMMIVSGVEEDCFATIDTGAARGAANALAIAGHPNSTRAAQVAAQLYRMFWSALSDRTRREVISVPAIMEVVERWPEIDKWTRLGRDVGKIAVPTSALGPILIYLADIAGRPDLSSRLLEGLRTGGGLAVGDPVLAFRNKAMELRANRGMRLDFIWPYAVKTVDAMEAGVKISRWGQIETTIMTHPARLKEHMAGLSPRRALIDLTPSRDLRPLPAQ